MNNEFLGVASAVRPAAVDEDGVDQAALPRRLPQPPRRQGALQQFFCLQGFVL